MKRPRVLFASYHCYHDPTSGAAVCTRDLFSALAARDWDCAAFTGPHLDDASAPPIAIALRSRPGLTSIRGAVGSTGFSLHATVEAGGFPVSIFTTEPPIAARPPTPADAAAFHAVLADAIARFRPDVVLTYGGDPASFGVRTLARRAGAKVAFWLHNFSYPERTAFAGCDAVIVPSEFCRNYRRVNQGLDCVAMPPVIDPARVLAERPDGGKYVTFVNPEPNKGVFWFARIAEVLGRTRPDIPLLVVEGRARTDWLDRTGIDWKGITSIHRMANTADPRQFYRLSRLMLMPSLWRESFGLVAAESLLNGIPVLASDRGALQEVVGAGGACLPVPERYTPESRIAPSREEVAQWVAAIVGLWDDPAAYRRASEAARTWSARWHPDAVVDRWETLLSSLIDKRP